MTDLFGKKKIIVDPSSYFSLDRRSVNGHLMPGQIDYFYNMLYKSGVYLRNGHPSTKTMSEATMPDFLRLALGKGWEFHVPPGGDFKIFNNDWSAIMVFKGKQLTFKVGVDDCEYLDPDPGDPPPFSLNDTRTRQRIVISTKHPVDKDKTIEGTGADSTLKEWTAFIKTGCKSDTGENLFPLIRADVGGTAENSQANSWFHDHYHETPIPYTPHELLNKQPVGKAFFVDYKSYYNEIMAAERTALYENYISNKFRLHNSLPNIYAFVKLMDNNSLMDHSVFDATALREYMQAILLSAVDDVANTPSNVLVNIKRSPSSVYNDLLRRHPLETLITLYGIIGANLGEYGGSALGSGLPMLKPLPGYTYPTKIIEKIITMNPEKIDIAGLIRSYLKEWLNALQYEETKQHLGVDYINSNAQFVVPQGTLENIGYNLIFSPNFIPVMNKANKFKDYFPMYNQIKFTTNTSTTLGDSMKKMFITRFISTQLAASQGSFAHTNLAGHPHGYTGVSDPEELKYYQNYRGTGNIFCGYVDQGEGNCGYPGINATADAAALIAEGENSWNPEDTRLLPASLWEKRDFVEYEEEKSYLSIHLGDIVAAKQAGLSGQDESDMISKGGIRTTGVDPEKIPTPNKKGAIDFPTALEEWIKNDDFSSLHNQWNHHLIDQDLQVPHVVRDVRNFITYVNKSEEDSINLSSGENVMWKTLLGSSFYAKLVDIYHKKKRSYSDLLAGKPAYTEDLFYRIEKHVKHDNAPVLTGAENDWKIIQNVIIPNTSEIDIAEHIDTQVKYGKHVAYKYKIYICRVVFGCRYKYNWVFGAVDDADKAYTKNIDTPHPWYSPTSTYQLSDQLYDDINVSLDSGFYHGTFALTEEIPWGSSGGEQFFKLGTSFHAAPIVTIEPSIKIIEDEVYNTGEVRILDRPPVSPDINIVPYRAVNNKIKVIMSGATDRYRAAPIKILDSDDEEFSIIWSAQRSLDDKVEFGSDDPISNFQVFRINKKPKSYRDFEFHPTNPFIFGGSGTLEDTILPNTKYYYTFRAVDNHGHISNPTSIYEVELIDDQGAVKPLIRTVSLEKEEKNLTARECQKYIFIKPSTKQLYFSDQADVDSIFTTDDNSNTKKKKYRMRLTSKGSGKKIDINFSFEKKIVVD